MAWDNCCALSYNGCIDNLLLTVFYPRSSAKNLLPVQRSPFPCLLCVSQPFGLGRISLWFPHSGSAFLRTPNPELQGNGATELSTARRAPSVVWIALVLPPQSSLDWWSIEPRFKGQLSLNSKAFKSSGIGGWKAVLLLVKSTAIDGQKQCFSRGKTSAFHNNAFESNTKSIWIKLKLHLNQMHYHVWIKLSLHLNQIESQFDSNWEAIRVRLADGRSEILLQSKRDW